MKNESLFYKSVKKNAKVTFFKGYRSKYDLKEKEVDVHLALDIVHKAHLQEYTDMFLISGDADVMYALQYTHPSQIYEFVSCNYYHCG